MASLKNEDAQTSWRNKLISHLHTLHQQRDMSETFAWVINFLNIQETRIKRQKFKIRGVLISGKVNIYITPDYLHIHWQRHW